MENKFKGGEEVTILGTDNQKANVYYDQASNNNELIRVWVHNTKAVYPYYGEDRLYPEWMLEKIEQGEDWQGEWWPE